MAVSGRAQGGVYNDCSEWAVPFMKAIVITKHGSADGLSLQEVATPVPQDNEVWVQVHVSTVTAGDVILRKIGSSPLYWPGVRNLLRLPPRKTIPGHEFSGVVEAVGKQVSRFKPGDEVFGTTTGLTTGANAESVVVPEDSATGVLGVKPKDLTFEEAAAVPVGAMTALYLLREGGIQSGQSVLIYGASGSVGTYALQLAKSFGAEVTAVCSTANVELMRSLGADRVIDYTTEDFVRSGQTYDLVFDAVGKSPAARSKAALKPGGRYVSIRSSTHESGDALHFLTGLLETGQIKPVIDRCYPLEKTAEAHRYVEQGHKKGNVVITVLSENGEQACGP